MNGPFSGILPHLLFPTFFPGFICGWAGLFCVMTGRVYVKRHISALSFCSTFMLIFTHNNSALSSHVHSAVFIYCKTPCHQVLTQSLLISAPGTPCLGLLAIISSPLSLIFTIFYDFHILKTSSLLGLSPLFQNLVSGILITSILSLLGLILYFTLQQSPCESRVCSPSSLTHDCASVASSRPPAPPGLGAEEQGTGRRPLLHL